MKLAKKMFACVLAIMLVGSFAVMAFAEEASAKFGLAISGEAVVGEEVTVTVSAEGAKGLESFDLVINFNAEVFELVGEAKKPEGSPVDMVTGGAPEGTTGEATGAGLFTESLATDDKVALAAYTFKVVKEGDFEFKLNVSEADGLEDFAGTATVTGKATDKAEEPTDEPTTTAPTTGGGDGTDVPQTGDAGLAIASGLIVLAGAAYVVSKKRK